MFAIVALAAVAVAAGIVFGVLRPTRPNAIRADRVAKALHNVGDYAESNRWHNFSGARIAERRELATR